MNDYKMIYALDDETVYEDINNMLYYDKTHYHMNISTQGKMIKVLAIMFRIARCMFPDKYIHNIIDIDDVPLSARSEDVIMISYAIFEDTNYIDWVYFDDLNITGNKAKIRELDKLCANAFDVDFSDIFVIDNISTDVFESLLMTDEEFELYLKLR